LILNYLDEVDRLDDVDREVDVDTLKSRKIDFFLKFPTEMNHDCFLKSKRVKNIQMLSFFSDLSSTKRIHFVSNLSVKARKSYFGNPIKSFTTRAKRMNITKTNALFSRLNFSGSFFLKIGTLGPRRIKRLSPD